MAERLIARACEQFRKEISPDQVDLIQSTAKLEDVRDAVQMIEKYLAPTQRLRNLGRILPFLDSLERYSKALEVACNGTDYLPWIWAPIKFVLLAVQEHAYALDKVLMAYAHIGSCMPRLSIYIKAFPSNQSFQYLIAFLFEDIIEFHRKAYSWITKPGFSMFFASVFGRFDDRFGMLITSISRISEQIDREAVALDIQEAVETRKKRTTEYIERDHQKQFEQEHSIRCWLELTNLNGEMRLDWLLNRHLEGTSDWILSNQKIRDWLQRGRGGQVLWINGKPGSGKSVLCARLIRFLRNVKSRKVCFFFCNFQTPSHDISTHILRSLVSQMLPIISDAVPYVYNEYVIKSRRPTTETLKKILQDLLALTEELRFIIDGIDEVAQSEHRNLLRDLLQLTKSSPTLKLLLVSQDLPTIDRQLSKQKVLKMSEERASIEKDLGLIVRDSLEDIVEMYGNQITQEDVQKLQTKILEKADGMYLWVHLILDLIGNASSLRDLQQQVDELPSTLREVYARLLNNVKSRCPDFSKVRRLFAWLICNRGKQQLLKPVARLGMVIDPDCTIINRETSTFANATDICKPFIEDGPGNSLVFVHSTVPQYLLHSDSGPFLSRPECEQSVTIGCLTQLRQSLELLDHAAQGNRLEIAVAKGFYALLPYANQYWASHLRACMDLQNEKLPDLSSQIEALSESISLLEQNPDENMLADYGEPMEVDSILAGSLSPKAVKLVTQYAREPEGGTDFELLHPLLARATKRYHELLRSLVVSKDLQGLETSDLLRFQEDFGSTAFMCLSVGCEKAVSGFSCQADLENHESSHSQSFHCVDGCAYNHVGFTNVQQLRSHIRKRHPSSIEAPVPKRFKRSGEDDTADTDIEPTKRGAQAPERRKLTEQEEQIYGVSTHKNLPSGPTFRYDRITKFLRSKSNAQYTRIINTLNELDIPVKLIMPTKAVVDQMEHFLVNIQTVLDLKKLSDKFEAEIKLNNSKKAEKERAERRRPLALPSQLPSP